MKFDFNGDPRYEPLTAWEYFWLEFLYAIPFIGFIFLIVFSISGANINRRSHARSHFCGLILVLIVLGIGLIIVGAKGGIAAIVDKLGGFIGSSGIIGSSGMPT